LRHWKWIGVSAIALLALAYGALSYFMGGPRDVYGFLRYALPQWQSGHLRVGDPAPDVSLVSVDGHSILPLRDRVGHRPLVLIFGSYT
jgi:hypothetical protein